MPRAAEVDGTLAFLSEGYRCVSNRCEALGSDVFATRLMLQPTICMRGEAAARLFCEAELFERRASAPRRVLSIAPHSGFVISSVRPLGERP